MSEEMKFFGVYQNEVIKLEDFDHVALLELLKQLPKLLDQRFLSFQQIIDGLRRDVDD